MRESYILQQIFKSFHQPPSLSNKESSKLLALLTTSFRKQLDKEHGFGFEFRKDNLQPTTATKPHTKSPTAISPRRRSLSEPVPPTERLFRSILTDPLFATSNAQPNAENSQKTPMEVFELAVSRGLMTLDKCQNCLLAERRMILNSGAPTVWEGMRDSGAGRKVLKWLRASGLAEEGKYLRGMFTGVFAPFAVAEGLQEILWHDFTRLCSASSGDVHTVGRTLLAIIYAELNGPNSLDGAISSLNRAYSILENFAEIRRSVLQPSARLVSSSSTVRAQLYPKPTQQNFSILKDIITQVIVKHNTHIAHLDLHDPTSPSPRKALKLIKGLSYDRTHMAPKRFIYLGLDAAKYLLEHEEIKEARWVLGILSSSFPEHNLARVESLELGHTVSEAFSLQKLEDLSLA